MFMKSGRRALWLGFGVLAAAGWQLASPEPAQALPAGVCADDGGGLPDDCTKEIRVHNNTGGKIWVVFQASIQLTDAANCTVQEKGGGDAWLQTALGVLDECLAVKNDYYAFINPKTGIKKNEYVSIKVPWWSKRKKDAPDRYVDWWRGARVIIFDDNTAFDEVYKALKPDGEVNFTADSRVPRCDNSMDGNVCTDVPVYEVTPGHGIDPHLPFQLNELTFANVCKVESTGMFLQSCVDAYGGPFIDFNQNYNVSNVDQVYLPLAMEPVRKPADVGYMGTTMKVGKFRRKLAKFTGSNDNPDKPDWPVYNNPEVEPGKKMYPKAGIRVPSAHDSLAYYMSPGTFPDGTTPVVIPKNPPLLIDAILDQWGDCTDPAGIASDKLACKKNQAELYESVDAVFLANYKKYVDTCDQIPEFLQPVSMNPPMPKLTAYLTFIYGWVPFNVGCGNDELPTADSLPPGSRSVINYFSMQYNFEDLPGKEKQWFNPYTQLVHSPADEGGLEAAAYAFSIDDHASYLSNSGGKLSGGLIFTVGGPEGLRNGKQHAPPVPTAYAWYDFSIGLGAPADQSTGPYWKKYGICSNKANIPFPSEDLGGFVLGVDPAMEEISESNPCPITLLDTEKRKYRIVIKEATPPGTMLPQQAIWPPWGPTGLNPNVVECPDEEGLVDPADWCMHSNQVSQPSADPNQYGFYTIGTPGPLANP